MHPKQTLPLLLLALIWGSYYVASQQTVGVLTVFPAGVMVRLVAMVLLGTIMAARGQLSQLLHVRAVWKRLLLIGLLGFLLDLTAFIGLSLSSVGSGTALLKCDVLFVNLISVFYCKERFTRLDWLFSFVMLAGVFLILGVNPLSFRFDGLGDVFFLLSALFVSINAFVIRSVQQTPEQGISDHVIAFYNNAVTLVLFSAATFFSGGFVHFSQQTSEWLLPAALAGVGQTLIYQVYYANLRRFPVWLVKVFLLFMPVVSLAICAVLFGELPGGMECMGIVVVLGGGMGILLEQRRKQNAVREPAAGNPHRTAPPSRLSGSGH